MCETGSKMPAVLSVVPAVEAHLATTWTLILSAMTQLRRYRSLPGHASWHPRVTLSGLHDTTCPVS